jgi:hypothetical protein
MRVGTASHMMFVSRSIPLVVATTLWACTHRSGSFRGTLHTISFDGKTLLLIGRFLGLLCFPLLFVLESGFAQPFIATFHGTC